MIFEGEREGIGLSSSMMLRFSISLSLSSFSHLVHRSLWWSRRRRTRWSCCRARLRLLLLLLRWPGRARPGSCCRRRSRCCCCCSTRGFAFFALFRGGLLLGRTALLSPAAHSQATLESAAAIRCGVVSGFRPRCGGREESGERKDREGNGK